MVADPISDMLTRIRNAQAVGHLTVETSYSKLNYAIAKLLEQEGWLGKVDTQGHKNGKIIEITLKYGADKKPVITDLQRVSKPGRRMYIKKSEIKPIRQGYGMSVISTPDGLMTNKQALKAGLGGEIIFNIW